MPLAKNHAPAYAGTALVHDAELSHAAAVLALAAAVLAHAAAAVQVYDVVVLAVDAVPVVVIGCVGQPYYQEELPKQSGHWPCNGSTRGLLPFCKPPTLLAHLDEAALGLQPVWTLEIADDQQLAQASGCAPP